MKKNLHIVMIVLIIFACTYVAGSFVWFQNALSDNLFQESKDRLQKSNDSSIHFINETFNEFEDQLDLIADFSKLYSHDEEAIVQMLKQMNEKKEEIDYGLFNLQHHVFMDENISFDPLDWDAVMNAMQQNKRYISDVVKINNHKVIVMAIPILNKNRVVGGVLGIYQVDYLTAMFSNSFFGGIGATMIVQSNGEMVASYQGMEYYSDFYAMLDQFHYPNSSFNKTSMMKNIEHKKSGFVIYEANGKQRYMSYAPIGINDWNAVNLVMAESLSPRFSKILQQFIMLAISYVIVFTFILLLLFRAFGKMQKMQKEVLEGHRFEMLARLQKSAIIFEYDFQRGYLHVSSNYERNFGLSANYASVLEKAIRILAEPSDLEELRNQIYEEGNIHMQLQLKDCNGIARWYEVEGGVIYDDQHRLISLIGFIYDIHEAYLEKQQLLKKANMDELSNTFTKGEILHQIHEAIEEAPNALHALLFLDLDNFKKINDTYGHMVGDEVLVKLGELLNTDMGQGVAGRFGGDEFVVFFKDITSKHQVIETAKHLLELVQEEMQYPIGISIGISIYGKDACCIEEFIEHADVALYQAKNKGKGQFQLYEKETN